MLNKKNVIISGLASVMLTYSFNYMAFAGLGNIKVDKAINNANLSVNKPSNLVDSTVRGLVARNHSSIHKSFDAMKGHLSKQLPSQFKGATLTEDPVLTQKRRKVSELTQAF